VGLSAASGPEVFRGDAAGRVEIEVSEESFVSGTVRANGSGGMVSLKLPVCCQE
jgi:hypothetical protein